MGGRAYVSRSWPNPGTPGEQVQSMYDRLKEALSKEASAKAQAADSLNGAGAGGNGGRSTGAVNGQVVEPR